MFRYKNQLCLTKLKSKRFVSGCGKQCKLLWKFPRNTISFCGVRNIGVWGNNYERYLWLKRLGARVKIIREVARRVEKGYLQKKVKMRSRILEGYIRKPVCSLLSPSKMTGERKKGVCWA